MACLSRWVVQDFVQSGRLVVLRTTLAPMQRQCYWVVHRDKHLTPALQRFVELLGASAGTRTDASTGTAATNHTAHPQAARSPDPTAPTEPAPAPARQRRSA